MATKKTTTKVDVIEEEVIDVESDVTEEEVIDVESEVTPTTPTVKERKKFNLDDMIMCRSVCHGELLYPAKKSGLLYRFEGYGDRTEIEFQDLQALKSTRSNYLYRPCFIIEDEELLEQWPDLKKIVDKVSKIDGEKLFNLPINQFKKALKELPIGFRITVRNMANAKINDGTLDSLAKIKALDEVLGTDLRLLID
jgi:hypothetical protein